MPTIRLLRVAAPLLLATTSVHAQQAEPPKCTFSATPISFGTIDVTNGRPYDATGTFNYTCTGEPREIIRICPSLGVPKDGPRYLEDGAGHKLFFNLYTDAARTDVWGSFFASTKAPTIDAAVGRGARVADAVTVYARVAPGQKSVPPGVYKSSIDSQHSVTMYAYATKGACSGSSNGSSYGHPVVNITARVGSGGPESQPITAPDASRTTGASAQSPSQQPQQHRGFWQTMVDNAQYQRDKQNGTLTDDERRADRDRNRPSSSKPLCKMSDSDVHLVDGTWAGPNCIAIDVNGKPVYKPGERPSLPDDEQANRAAYIESHSCMTTVGADKAGPLAEDCTRATRAPHSACNAQQNTCDEIKDATRRGCDGLGAEAPDFCRTRYQ